MSEGRVFPGQSRPLATAAGGAALCAVALVIVLRQPPALVGWLAAATFWAGLPLGALCLALAMRLIPGPWREELGAPLDTMALLSPLSLIAFLPVLAGPGSIYGWMDRDAVYMSRWFFSGRSATFLVSAGLLAAFLLRRQCRASAVAVAGMIAFVLADTAIAVDWLMSLDRSFHSSGFGLYALSIQTTSALAAGMLLRLRNRAAPPRSDLHGALLLTLLLLWIYFAFMQYFIVWSGDQPHGVAWYLRRAQGAWLAMAWVAGTLGILSCILLLFPPIRSSRPWLVMLASLALAGRALETAWLAVPSAPATAASTAAVVAGLAFTGLGALFLAALGAAGPYAERWRSGSAALPMDGRR